MSHPFPLCEPLRSPFAFRQQRRPLRIMRSPATNAADGGSGSRVQRSYHGVRIPGSDAKEGARRALRLAAALFPVLEGCDAHSDHQGEFRLGLIEFPADRPNIVWPKLGHSPRPQRSPLDSTCLPDTRDKLSKQPLIHASPSLIRRLRNLNCAGDRSSCSLLIYEKQENRFISALPVIDHPCASAFSASCRRPPQLAQATNRTFLLSANGG